MLYPQVLNIFSFINHCDLYISLVLKSPTLSGAVLFKNNVICRYCNEMAKNETETRLVKTLPVNRDACSLYNSLMTC